MTVAALSPSSGGPFCSSSGVGGGQGPAEGDQLEAGPGAQPDWDRGWPTCLHVAGARGTAGPWSCAPQQPGEGQRGRGRSGGSWVLTPGSPTVTPKTASHLLGSQKMQPREGEHFTPR